MQGVLPFNDINLLKQQTILLTDNNLNQSLPYLLNLSFLHS